LPHDRRDSPATDAAIVDALTTIVSRAAAAILAVRAGALDLRTKADRTPVTAADHAAEAIILDAVAQLLPGIPTVSEEAVQAAPPAGLAGDFVLVDPLDGTREFIAGRDEFTVNVALVSGGRPRLGVIAAPALGLVWRTRASGGAERLRLAPGAAATEAAERAPIRVRPRPRTGLVAAVSRSHLDAATEAYLARLGAVERIACGSALKFCRVAEGTADIYPRLGPTCEWDVAAGDAIVAAAGGAVTTPDGAPLAYGRAAEAFRVPAFIAWGGAAMTPHGESVS
jgi:3'(2'), 5'-bisphosphate nucleotidase